MSENGVVLNSSFNIQENAISDQPYLKELTETDEDFSNAIDVLHCILGERSKSIITELISIYERKSYLALNLHKASITDGAEEKKDHIMTT